MMYPNQMTERLVASRFLVACCLLAVCGDMWADSETDINKVSLTVYDGTVTAPTAGLLFRAYADRREYVADIGEDGKLNKALKCNSTEMFEAQADSKLDRPVAPIRLACRDKFAFAFTRMFVTKFPIDTGNQFASTGSSAKVFAEYADVFKAAGKPTAAKTWSDAAKISAVKSLGDAKTDKFLYRDPKLGFDLVFSPIGEVALKAKQREFGVLPTGKLDDDTLNAFVKAEAKPTNIGAIKCKQRNNRFYCEPTDGFYVKESPDTVILPSFALEPGMSASQPTKK